MKNIAVGIQMLFVAFGSTVLVPLLTGINPAIALFCAGVGTLIFQLITGGKIPIFLGSSFAFIAPLIYAINHWGMAAAQGAIMATALVYFCFALAIYFSGTDFIAKLFPPIVIAPVIMVIGLSLAPTAANMAMGLTGDGKTQLYSQNISLIVAGISLATTIGVALYTQGLSKLLAVLAGIVAGYIAATIFGLTDFSKVANAAWFSFPEMQKPSFNLEAILFFIPIALAPTIEHIGDVAVIGQVCNQDFIKSVGLHKTMTGDGLAILFAGFCGGPPVTTYSEVTGAVSVTGAKDPKIMIFAGFFAIFLAFSGKLSALLSTMPTPIMGGIMLLLFGSIAAMGARSLLQENANLRSERSVVIIAVVLVCGLGHLGINLFGMRFEGIGLCALMAIFLNLILPIPKDDKIS